MNAYSVFLQILATENVGLSVSTVAKFDAPLLLTVSIAFLGTDNYFEHLSCPNATFERFTVIINV
jgi:hypothetical protein